MAAGACATSSSIGLLERNVELHFLFQRRKLSSWKRNSRGNMVAANFSNRCMPVYAVQGETSLPSLPVENAKSVSDETRATGNPLGRKDLGKGVVKWVAQGMAAMAADIVDAEKKGDVEKKIPAGFELMAMAQPFLDRNAVPDGYEDLCAKVRSHYPTLLDHFGRELQQSLRALEKEGLVSNWQDTNSWRIFKKKAKTGGHRDVVRKSLKAKKPDGQLELSKEMVAIIQSKVDDFVDRFLELLRVERDAELDATQQALHGAAFARNLNLNTSATENPDQHEESGALCDLVAVSSLKGLRGTDIVLFRSRNSKHRLPPTSLSPGDMVCVRISNKEGEATTESVRGSVYKFCEDGASIEVAISGGATLMETLMKLSGCIIRIDRIPDLADATTYERNCAALRQLKKKALEKTNPAASAVAVLFGEGSDICELAQGVSRSADPVVFSDGNMFDESQQKGIQFGLDKQRPIVVIQGPPGTGKTSVVSDLITKAVARGDRVLATAPTNAAVDNLVERLSSAGLNIVRVGNPIRMAPTVTGKSLSYMIESELYNFKRSIGKEKAAIKSTLRQNPGGGDFKADLQKRLKQLGKSLKHKEEELINGTLKSAQVVLCTNIGAGDDLLKRVPTFDLAVVDEAGQAIEPSCWIPMLQSSRTILAGDICQLAPTVLSKQALDGGLGKSLMERAASLHGGILNTMLEVQYRMHASIANWASNEMYGGLLKSASAVSAQVLSDSPSVEATWRTKVPLLLLDTRQPFGSLAAGCEECLDYGGSGSFYNDGEADIVIEHVLALIDAGVPATSIAVQSPYLAQVQLLRERMKEVLEATDVQVESVDSFQGREADAVIISMVRSNNLGMVGFLADKRRINVAVTRARKHVAIVCDSSTVGSNEFLRRLLQHIRVHGEVRSVNPGKIPALV